MWTNSLGSVASWVIVDISTNEAVLETYNAKLLEALNLKRYKAVPILEYLQSLNRKGV
jgi:hypothetical protein